MSEQKTWLITGASQGLGASLVRRLLAKGHQVAATTRSLSALASSVAAGNGRLLPLEMNICDGDSVRAAISEALDRFGAIDVLVNNAGYGLFGGIEETEDDEVRAQYEVNVLGPLNVLRALLPHMRQRASGRILNISSIAGLVSFGGWGVYCSTKFALEGLSEALAQEVAPFGIKVSLVEPGYLRTNFLGSGALRSASQPLAAYQAIRDLQESLAAFHGQEIGDPDRAADAIIALSEMQDPPLRLVLGSDALKLAQGRIEQMERGLKQHEALTLSTDFSPYPD